MRSGTLPSAGRQRKKGLSLPVSVFENVPSSVIITDLAGKITHWNKGAEEMRGWKREEVIGKSILDMVPPESRERAKTVVKKIAELGSWTGEFELIRKDGTRFQSLSKNEALEDSDGRIVGIISVSLDISERKRIEKRLLDSEEKFRGIADRSFDGIFTIDVNGNITYGSPALWKMMGFKRDELLGQSIMKYIPATGITKVAHALKEVLSGKTIESFELETRRKDGSPVFVEVNASPVFDEGYSVAGIQGVVRDVTHHRQAEEIKSFYASIVESSPAGIASLGLDGILVNWNPAAEKILGYSAEEVIGRKVSILAPPGRASESVELLERLKKGEGAIHLDTVRRRKDGRLIDFSLDVFPIKDKSGTIIGTSSIFSDITERKRAQEAKSLLASIVESSPIGIVNLGLDGTITSWNPAAEKIYGYSAQEIIGQKASLFAPADRADESLGIVKRMIKGEGAIHLETVRVRKDGTPINVSLDAFPVKDESGTLVGVSGIFTDITERRQAQETKDLLASIVESSPLGMVTAALDGTITSWNPAAERIFGFSAEEMIGRQASVIAPGKSVEEQTALADRVRKGEHVQFVSTRARKDGTLFACSADGIAIKDKFGNVTGMSAFLADVSTQKATEEKIRSLQEARSRFVSAATHELKTPLVAIKGYSDLAASGALGELSGPLEHGMRVVGRNTERMLNLIKDLLEIERMESGALVLSKEIVDLNKVISESVDNLRPVMAAKKLEVNVVLPEVESRAMGDEVRLHEVMDNLLVNAVKFTPDHGKILLELRVDKGQIRITVSDSGIGISSEYLPHLFEPFSKIPKSVPSDAQELYGLYSTGLGLAVTKRLVEMHGGRIWAESAGEGKGSTFIFTVPSAPRQN